MSAQATLQENIQNRVNKFLPSLLGFVNSKPITAIKEGFMLTMPLTIIGSLFLLLSYVPIEGYDALWQESLEKAGKSLSFR